MIETVLEKLGSSIYIPKFRKLESEIGCGLKFHDLPSCYINGWMRQDMTKTWKKFGLNIERGANYFTMGRVVNGTSSRFDPSSPEYQSWLGGYTVRLASKQEWKPEDHFKLAIADQNSWLGLYGDSNPTTSVEDREFSAIGKVQIGRYSGTLYEGGCTTHSDVGVGCTTTKLRFACIGMAAVFNLSNPNLKLKGKVFRPKMAINSYETLKLRGYVTILDIGENTEVILYGNGTTDTFDAVKNDLLDAIKSCEIIELK